MSGKEFFACILLAAAAPFATAQTPQEAYIEKYASLAVGEMQRSGVPASITLAQGMLESASGQSSLAVKGNNHFGIKCHNGWTGKTMKWDDDAPGECFRVYGSVEDSFRDHSDFLRYRDRYKFLFDLDPTDYRGWAYGLSKAGYATDPGYPAKLIKYIEEYGLSKYDTGLVAASGGGLPPSPHSIEQPVAANGADFRFSLSRELYSVNGVPFIYSQEGETYASIAKANRLFKCEILRFNDEKTDRELLPGTVVYLQAKKNKTQKGLDKYIVSEDGEDFHAICQRFAVREKAVRKLNGLTGEVKLYGGDELKLR